MLYLFGKLVLFMGVGVAWRRLNPMHVNADVLQRSLMALLYAVFIPGLVLMVLWKAPMNVNTLRIAVVALGSTAAGLAAGWFLLRNQSVSPGIKGALIIAAAFGNVVFIGIPVATSLVASWTTRAAVEFEAFAIVPLLFTAGAMLVHRFGEQGSAEPPWMAALREPIMWAIVVGVLFNLMNVKMPGWLGSSLNLLAAGLTPVALITVGLALQWQNQWNQIVKLMLPVAAIQLILIPVVLWILAHIVGLAGPQTFKSLILLAAMPSAMLGFVICDRFRLDTGVYSAAFALTTGLAFITVPLWYQALISGLIK